MTVYNCLQGSQEWHALRKGVVTGSLIGSLNSPSTLSRFVRAIRGEPVEFTGNAATRYGTEMEPLARESFEGRHNVAVDTSIGFATHPDNPHHGYSPDGICDYGPLLEIKCPYSSEIPVRPPQKYVDQVQWGLYVLNLRDGILCYQTAEEHREFSIPRDDEHIAKLIERADKFLARADEMIESGEDPVELRVDEEYNTLEAYYDELRDYAESIADELADVKLQMIELTNGKDTDGLLTSLRHVQRAGSLDYKRYLKDKGLEPPGDEYRGKPTTYVRIT